MRKIESCKEGDILISKEGDTTKILARIGAIIARSSWSLHDCFSEWLTISEAKRRDYRLQHKGRYPMTLEEAESTLGVEIIIKK